MAASKQGGTAAAAEQLGSMSLGEKSVKGKAEPDAEKNGTPTKMCSACGEKSDTLKKCTACKCVWYCDRDCQNKHRKEHKKECKRIKLVLDERGGKLDVGTELDIGPLEKLPPREECPICMRAMPIPLRLHRYSVCCGKTLCCGCSFVHFVKSGEQPTCAFCREPAPESEEECLAPLRKRVERKDPTALCNMGMAYGSGRYGLPVNQAKCIDLLRESAGLGSPDAHYQLGCFHRIGNMGLEQNGEEAIRYTEKAAEGGNILALHNLGCAEKEGGNRVAAMRHWRLAASGGYRSSMGNLIFFFENGFLHHGDLAKAMQAFYRSRAEMKCEERDQYIKYLKTSGSVQYNEAFLDL
jgi:hypothetical protein